MFESKNWGHKLTAFNVILKTNIEPSPPVSDTRACLVTPSHLWALSSSPDPGILSEYGVSKSGLTSSFRRVRWKKKPVATESSPANSSSHYKPSWTPLSLGEQWALIKRTLIWLTMAVACEFGSEGIFIITPALWKKLSQRTPHTWRLKITLFNSTTSTAINITTSYNV